MKVNKHNLEITKHCGTKPASGGQRIDLFHFTDTGTMVIAEGAVYAIKVSAISVDPQDKPCSVAPNFALGSGGIVDLPIGDIDKVPNLPSPASEPIHEITIKGEFLKAIADAAIEFGAMKDAIRIRFYGPNKPISFNAVNSDTRQTWEALLMPRDPHQDDEVFKVESELEKAMRLAKELMGE